MRLAQVRVTIDSKYLSQGNYFDILKNWHKNWHMSSDKNCAGWSKKICSACNGRPTNWYKIENYKSATTLTSIQ